MENHHWKLLPLSHEVCDEWKEFLNKDDFN